MKVVMFTFHSNCFTEALVHLCDLWRLQVRVLFLWTGLYAAVSGILSIPSISVMLRWTHSSAAVNWSGSDAAFTALLCIRLINHVSKLWTSTQVMDQQGALKNYKSLFWLFTPFFCFCLESSTKRFFLSSRHNRNIIYFLNSHVSISAVATKIKPSIYQSSS